MQHAIEAIPRQRHYLKHILSKSTFYDYFSHEAEIPYINPLAEVEQQVNDLKIILHPVIRVYLIRLITILLAVASCP